MHDASFIQPPDGPHPESQLSQPVGYSLTLERDGWLGCHRLVWRPTVSETGPKRRRFSWSIFDGPVEFRIVAGHEQLPARPLRPNSPRAFSWRDLKISGHRNRPPSESMTSSFRLHGTLSVAAPQQHPQCANRTSCDHWMMGRSTSFRRLLNYLPS